MSQAYPKILSISLNTWRSDSPVHTQTDLFRYWQPDRLAQIYTMSDLPDTPVCRSFFQISENAVMKSVINRRAVGQVVENGAAADAETAKAIRRHAKIYAFGHRRKSWLLTLAREFVWLFGRWKTDQLDAFLEAEAPDCYFVPIYNVVYTARIQRYILKKYPKPYVCYLSDDNYSYMNCGRNPLAYIHRRWLRRHVKALAEGCTEMFTITATQAAETDRLFGTHSVVLTKGIDYTGRTYREIRPGKPIRMVYTGNLLIGRDATLVAVAEAMGRINRDGMRITLDVYSPTELARGTVAKLNANGCTYHGHVPHDEVAAIQEAADAVIFAESLERRHRLAARLSFSTKLTDYFKSGKCIFAIGDKSVAPMEYLRENDAAVLAYAYPEIEKQLRRLVDHPELLDRYGRRAFACGQENHNEEQIRERFVSTFRRACASPPAPLSDGIFHHTDKGNRVI